MRKIIRSEMSYSEPVSFDLEVYTMLKREDLDYLEKEIASLKEQLRREMACTDFYANKENWSYVNQYNKTLMKMNEDIEWVSPGVFLDKFAGKLARSTQARREK